MLHRGTLHQPFIQLSNFFNTFGSSNSHFFEFKELLCTVTDQPLSIIDWGKPLNIHTDASDYMMAGVLSETEEDGNDHSIAFYIKKLNKTKRAWSTIENKSFAILEALNCFRSWIFGYKIVYSFGPKLFILINRVCTKKARNC